MQGSSSQLLPRIGYDSWTGHLACKVGALVSVVSFCNEARVRMIRAASRHQSRKNEPKRHPPERSRVLSHEMIRSYSQRNR
jgi:hypothetical protein